MPLLLLFCFSTFNYSNERIVFCGKPIIKISENGVSRVVEEISSKDAREYKVIITAVEDKYFWLTRNNVSLKRILSGAYIYYVAVNGSGYIKVLRNDLKDNLMPYLDETEKKFDYIEHMTMGLKTISYYGQEF